MLNHVLEGEDPFAEATLAQWIVTLHRFMLNLLLLDDSKPTPLTNNLHVFAFVELVRTQQKFIIC
jgi:hypothetical protein